MNRLEAHKVLGTNESMSADDIKKAYRKLASKHHPDKNKGKEESAKIEFQKVQEALDVLEGKVKSGPQPSNAGGNPFAQGFSFNFGAGGPDINEILRNFHSRANRPPPGDIGENYQDNWGSNGPSNPGHQRQSAPSIMTATIGITMAEAFNGCTKMIDIPNPASIAGSPTQVVIPPGCSEYEIIKEIASPSAQIRVMIKIQSEYQVMFGNLLNQGTGDIYKELKVSPLTMIMGGFLEVETIDGGVVSARIPAGIEANTTLKLKGKGYWTSQKCHYRGDCMLRIIPHIQKLEDIDPKTLKEFVDVAKPIVEKA